MKILGIIPARSGSKGLKDKNIKELDGKPLIGHTIEAAKRSGIFEDIILSTDSEKYAEIGIKYGAIVPFLRTESLSNDTAKISDTIFDILDKLKIKGKEYDYFMLLQPTSPLRDEIDIKNALLLCKEKNADFIVSLCESEHSPLWMNVLEENLSLNNFINVVNKNRQELKKYYRVNGAIYLAKIEEYRKKINFYSEKSFAYIMDKKKSVDIDDEYDFIFAECLMKKLKKEHQS